MVREKLKDNRGFTIIELVAVIAILLIITAIAMPSITSLFGRTEEKISKEKERAFISAARDYVSDNYNNINNSPCNIALSDLNSLGYLSDNSYKVPPLFSPEAHILNPCESKTAREGDFDNE